MRDVWIIGAGISGLSINEFLRKNDYRIRLIEKNDYLGGRIKSISVGSSVIDIGSQFFCRSDKYIWKIIERRGLEDKLIRLDFSDISFLCGNKLCQDNDTVGALIDDILKNYEPCNESEFASFDEWFLSNFNKDELFIPKSIINAITFTDSSRLTVGYGIYILETFFDECFTLKGGLKELIQSISKNVTVEMGRVRSIVFKDDKAARLLIDKDKIIDVSEDFVICTAPPSTVKIIGNKRLESILSKIKFRGCAVTIFKTKKSFEDKPDYIFVQKSRSPVSVIEQFNIGGDTFVGCLIPHSESISISKQKAVDWCISLLKVVIDENFKDFVEKTFYEDWTKGLPLVDVAYSKHIRKLKEAKIRNFVLAGDYTTSFPSMDFAVKSAIEVCAEIDDLR